MPVSVSVSVSVYCSDDQRAPRYFASAVHDLGEYMEVGDVEFFRLRVSNWHVVRGGAATFLDVAAEQVMLTLCDGLVLGGSGFSEMAAMWAEIPWEYLVSVRAASSQVTLAEPHNMATDTWGHPPTPLVLTNNTNSKLLVLIMTPGRTTVKTASTNDG